MLIAKVAGVKTVLAEGNIFPWYDPALTPVHRSLAVRAWRSLYLSLGVLMCRLADAVRAQSDSIKEGMIKAGVEADKIVVIPAGSEVAPSSQAPNTGRETRIAFIGRLSSDKNAEMLIDICRIAQSVVPHVKFEVYGDGPLYDKLRRFANVRHVGTVPRDILLDRLVSVDAVLSFQKELGRAEIEALSAGKVLLALNAGEIPKIIRHMENGILCDPYPESYIDAIKFVDAHKEELCEISLGARATVKEKYDWDGVGRKWLKLCQRLEVLPSFPTDRSSDCL